MISGYKHLSHDGYEVSTDFNPSAGYSPEFEEDNYGLTLGTRFDGSEVFGTAKGSVTLGVLANYTHTDVDVGASGLPGPLPSGSANIDSWSLGGYGLVTDGRRYGLLTIVGTIGSPETDNALLGATADYNTYGFAASAMSGVLVPVGDAKLDLRGGFNYITSQGDDYTDSIGSRYEDARMEEFSGTISARLFSVVRLEDYNIRPFVQAGLNHRFHYENEVTIDSVGFAFDDADTSVFGRAGIDFDLSQSMQGYLAVRGDASEDFSAIAAQVGVTFKLD
jgi:outer membrane autotransporter protein